MIFLSPSGTMVGGHPSFLRNKVHSKEKLSSEEQKKLSNIEMLSFLTGMLSIVNHDDCMFTKKSFFRCKT